MSPRSLRSVIPAQRTSDGAGVNLFRSIGTQPMPMVDPFLMLDEFRTDDPKDYLAGFPDHPHRGFETVTYMLAGRMQHADSRGNRGELGPGSIQWMTAGRGIVHSEMPLQEDGRMQGFQLWVNLPAANKLMAPRYQDIPGQDVPVTTLDDATVKVLAGTIGGVTGPVRDIVTDPLLLDVTVPAGATVTLPLPETHNAFVYVFEGSGAFGGAGGDTEVSVGHLAVPGDGGALVVRGGPVRFLLGAGRPIGEPVARYGPFVMNTSEEIHTAIRDFQAGRLG